MSEILSLVEASALAQYLKTARWGYAAVNGLHVFGIAMLVGSILPLNLRLDNLVLLHLALVLPPPVQLHLS